MGSFGRRSTWWGPVAAAIALLAVLAILQAVGTGARRFAPSREPYRVRSAAEGFDLLDRLGVKGRTLVLYDSRTRVVPFVYHYAFMEWLDGRRKRPPVTEDSLVSSLVYAGIARRVFVVVPESDWPRISQAMSARPDLLPDPSGYAARVDGVRIVVTRDLPELAEPPLVYVAGAGGPGALPKDADVVVRQEGPR